MGDLVGLRGVKEETLLEAASGKAVRTGWGQREPAACYQTSNPARLAACRRGSVPGSYRAKNSKSTTATLTHLPAGRLGRLGAASAAQHAQHGRLLLL